MNENHECVSVHSALNHFSPYVPSYTFVYMSYHIRSGRSCATRLNHSGTDMH
jgi:hypothetical protein